MFTHMNVPETHVLLFCFKKYIYFRREGDKKKGSFSIAKGLEIWDSNLDQHYNCIIKGSKKLSMQLFKHLF